MTGDGVTDGVSRDGMTDEGLSGRRVLVAGASSGMGRATALAAARAGARLVLFARRADALTKLAEEIGAAGGQALVVAGDATDADAVGRAVDVAVREYGGLDVLVNSVGTNVRERSLTELGPAGWRELLSTNLDAAYVLTQAVLPTFRAQGDGLLVHISSSAAKRPDASGVGYQASKAGVAALAHATMEEERANGIRVSVLFPGFTDTPLVERRPVAPTPEQLAAALRPDDVARMCLAVMALPSRAYVPELLLYPSQP
ncbi:SDR family oxidoreductase [Actinopolymorpha rutila]|uniref:NADP-dependent 3-hydroxy acid dehydrogenase YdfG n=1 Tax=Actinopolymorpha rutila TaxID=446787 RepID=A0A852Z5T7_9ACTN|nr:NADP-dependent 3-hydroxy acid dehydrogenase YdfG [Actinopolymorpha rutila]